jgi:hypothetical protein
MNCVGLQIIATLAAWQEHWSNRRKGTIKTMPRKQTTQHATGIATEFEKIEYRKVTIELDTRIHDELTNMIGYIESTRDIKPTLDAVITVLLRKAIQVDGGYNQWKEGGTSKSRKSNQTGGEVAANESTARA